MFKLIRGESDSTAFDRKLESVQICRRCIAFVNASSKNQKWKHSDVEITILILFIK